MSAESPRRCSRLPGNAVRPQPASDKTVMESVVDFFQDVAYNSQQDDKEKVIWVQFEQADVYDVNSNPSSCGYSSGSSAPPLLLILGYANGVQIWMIPSSGEAQEVLSLRQGPVRQVRFLVQPTPAFDVLDMFCAKRPLVAISDAFSAGQPYCSVKFLSLKTGDEVHHIPYTEPVTDIRANDRVVVVAFDEKLIVYDSCRFRERFTITACYSAKELCHNPNPIALGSRWLAYADKKLVSVHQSCGGMVTDSNQSYTATILSAAKTFTKGLSLIGETVASSLTGNKPYAGAGGCAGGGGGGAGKKTAGSPDSPGCKPGVVTVVDVQNIDEPQMMVQEDSDGTGLIAHFVAHASGQPVAAMSFDPSGTLLLTADSLGHSFHVFRIMAHPLCCALGAVHHLYTLHRGDTTAKVQAIDFTLDSRWVAVTTLRGTTHVFPITTYGGPVNVRTHTSARVVNRASRFHRSAGLDDIGFHPSSGGRESPSYASGSPSSSPGRTGRHGFGHERGVTSSLPSSGPMTATSAISNANNPRLPPYPTPTFITPAIQIRHNLAIPGIGGGSSAGTGGSGSGTGKSRSSASQGAAGLDCVCVAACFAAPRGYLAGSPPMPCPADDKRAIDSLFVVNWTGVLTEYHLEPRAKSGLEKITEESPIEVSATAWAQWPLARSMASAEVKLPLPSNNPLILACESVMAQKANALQLNLGQGSRNLGQPSREILSSDSSTDGNDEQWLSQVEIITHTGPHRRLWMGPQFAFKTFQSSDAGTTVCLSSSSALLSDCPESQASMVDIDSDMKSLCLNPRSNPVEMPAAPGGQSNVAGAMRVTDNCSSVPYATFIEAAESGSYGQSPSVLEARYSWSDGTQGAASANELVEDQLRQHLEDAMNESPLKDPHAGHDFMVESPKFYAGPSSRGGTATGSRSYSVRPSPPHSVEHMLVFPGDSGNVSSDSN